MDLSIFKDLVEACGSLIGCRLSNDSLRLVRLTGARRLNFLKLWESFNSIFWKKLKIVQVLNFRSENRSWRWPRRKRRVRSKFRN